MNTNKIWTKFLMAGILLGLLFTTACGWEINIKSPEEQALAEHGDAIMTVLQAGDLQAIDEVLSLEAQQMLDKAMNLAGGVVNVEKLVEENAPEIATWEFDRARIFTKDGALRGKLDGRVEFVDGKSCEMHLELEQQDGTWKLCGWTLGK